MQFAIHLACRARQGFELDFSVFRVQQPVKLAAAGFHALGHGAFGQLLFLHFLGQMPRKHPLYGNRLRLRIGALLAQKIVEARADPALGRGPLNFCTVHTFGIFRGPAG